MRVRRGGGALRATGVPAAVAACLLLSACAVPRPPEARQPPTAVPEPVSAPSPVAAEEVSEEVAPQRVAGFDAVERAVVRVRNVRCGSGIATGSGFAVDANTLITNEHVVAGAADLQVSTYDGQELSVRAADISTIADLAVVRTEQPLPAYVPLAAEEPVTGEPVSVIGFPLGGRMTTSRGAVLGLADDPLGSMAEQVLVTDAPVEQGSSGSAVLDADGEVVGVVYAGAVEDEQSFAVRVSVLSELLDGDHEGKPPSCG